MIFVKIRLFRP